MRKILTTTQATNSDTFRGSGGKAIGFCTIHNGGSWVLQIKAPEANSWVSLTDVSFTKTDALQFIVPQGNTFRFSGGSTGAEIYVQGGGF